MWIIFVFFIFPHCDRIKIIISPFANLRPTPTQISPTRPGKFWPSDTFRHWAFFLLIKKQPPNHFDSGVLGQACQVVIVGWVHNQSTYSTSSGYRRRSPSSCGLFSTSRPIGFSKELDMDTVLSNTDYDDKKTKKSSIKKHSRKK